MCSQSFEAQATTCESQQLEVALEHSFPSMAPVMHEGNMKVVPHPLQPVDELINTVTEEPMSEDEWVLFEHQTTV